MALVLLLEAVLKPVMLMRLHSLSWQLGRVALGQLQMPQERLFVDPYWQGLKPWTGQGPL